MEAWSEVDRGSKDRKVSCRDRGVVIPSRRTMTVEVKLTCQLGLAHQFDFALILPLNSSEWKKWGNVRPDHSKQNMQDDWN